MVFGQVWSAISSIGRRQSIPYLPLNPGSPRLPFLKHQRSQTRLAIAGAIALLVLLSFAASVISFASAPYNRNLAFYHTPAWTHTLLSPFYGFNSLPSTGSSRTGGGDVLLRAHGAPETVWPLLNGTWAGDWVVPELTPAQYTIRVDEGTIHEALASPAVLMLHVFSEASPAGRRRRETLRKYSPLRTVPAHFQHLIELRYVVFDSDPATWDETRSTSLPLDLGDDLYAQAAKLELTKEEDEAVRKEMAEHRDVVRLQAPAGTFEATWEWIRWAGSAASREAHWILKCSDDMLPVLPNIIPDLMTHDPTVPTYFGSSIARKAGYDFYFDGGMYGFSWGLLQTLAEVTLDARIVHAAIPEDALVGELMYQLPSKPLCRDLANRAAMEDEDEDEEEGEDANEDEDEKDMDPSEGEPEPVESISNQTPAIDSIVAGDTNERRRRMHARDFDPVSETFVPDHHRSSWPHRLKSMLPFTSKWDASASASSSSAHHHAAGAGAAVPAYSEADDGVLLSGDAFPRLTLASGECLLEPTAWDARPPRGGWRSGWPYPSGSGLLEDPRTGLVRLDWETSVGVRGGPGTDEDQDVLGWRVARPEGQSITDENDFDQAYKAAWHDLSEIFHAKGRPFQWQVPEPIQWLYEQDALNLEGL